MSQHSKELASTTDSRTFKIQKRRAIAASDGGCLICALHRKENAKRAPRRSWKLRTKRQKQHR